MNYKTLFNIGMYILFLMLLTGTMTVNAEEGTVKILSPWKAKGQVYKVGVKQTQFVGEFGGIMYVESQEGVLNTAIFVCPAVSNVDWVARTMEASGRCHIVAADGNIFAKFTCNGAPGRCSGEFILTGGTDRFEKISGSGPMSVRSALSSFMAEIASGDVIQSAEGLAVWPALSYKIPN